MPYPSEHAARQRAPGGFASFRRTHPKGWPAGVDAIWGVKRDGGAEIQSVRFDRSKWSEKDSKQWLKDHGFTVSGFEVATGKQSPAISSGGAQDKTEQSISLRCQIAKVDEYEHKVFGWLYVCRGVDGQEVVDHSGEVISIKTLETASYKYVHEHRKMGDMHGRTGDGEVVETGYMIECVVFTQAKRKAMVESLGLPPDTLEGRLPDGMWVGYQITDPELWADVLSGKKRALSLGGRAQKVPLDQGVAA
jgi:hypothetical protein